MGVQYQAFTSRAVAVSEVFAILLITPSIFPPLVLRHECCGLPVWKFSLDAKPGDQLVVLEAGMS